MSGTLRSWHYSWLGPGYPRMPEVDLVMAPTVVGLQGGTSVFVLTTCYLAGLLPVALSDWSNIVGVVCYVPLVLTCHTTTHA
jgi:hypothetical protein